MAAQQQRQTEQRTNTHQHLRQVTYLSSVISNKEVRPRLHLPIFFMQVQISIFKAKNWHKRDTWIVTVIEDENQILKQDVKTRARLNDEYYGSKFKGQRGIRIEQVYSCKQIGTTSW